MPLCIIKTCKNRTQSRPILGQCRDRNINNISYHRIPKNDESRKLWLDVLGLNAELIPVGGRICSAHFAKEAFDCTSGRRRLRPNALPYIEAIATEPVLAMESVVDDVPSVPSNTTIASSMCNTTDKIDKATSSPPGCSHSIDQSTNVSPKRKHDSPEKNYLRKILKDNDVPSNTTIASSMCDTTDKIDKATSPAPGCSHSMDKSTNVSPKRKYDSPEKNYLRQELKDTRKFYIKKVKLLQQKIRRKESRIVSLKAILKKNQEK